MFNSLPQPPARTRSVVDRRPTFPQWQAVYDQAVTRPISWHTPYDVSTPLSQYDASLQSDSLSYMSTPFTAPELQGVFTPLSMPHADEPQITELVTPLDEYPNHLLDHNYSSFSYPAFNQNIFWQPDSKPNRQIDSLATTDDYVPAYDSMYTQFQATKLDTAPPSPSFLPIQSNALQDQLTSSANMEADITGEELIGMGLYDSPADVQSSRRTGSVDSGFGRRESAGRGLKLEDAFEPPPSEDENDDDSQNVSEDGNDDYDDDHSCPGNVVEIPDQSEPIYSQPNFVGQTFYLDQDDAYSQYVGPMKPISSSDQSFHIFPNNEGYGWI